MNIEDLLQSLPSREDIANAVGMQQRSSFSSSNEFLPALGIFGTGMLFGAGLALLFAPKSGSEMRQDIGEKVQEFGGQAREMAEEYAGQGQSSGRQSGSQSGMGGQSGGQ